MLKFEISTIIFGYLFFTVGITLLIWAVAGYARKKDTKPMETEHIWKCSMCFNIYVDSKHKDISVCPQCESYNKRG